MVGQISGEGSDSNSNRGGQGENNPNTQIFFNHSESPGTHCSGQRENNPNTRIFFNHIESPGAVRALIQGALDPLPVNPVPSRVVIHNIVVTKNREGRLSVTCEVDYESHRQG